MLMRAQFTRDDLERAYNEFVERHGRETALAVLVKTTGTRDLSAVAEHRFVCAMAGLVGGLFAGGSGKMAAQASSRDRLKSVHDKLNTMATAIYAERRNERA